jgi:hypothetical protein
LRDFGCVKDSDVIPPLVISGLRQGSVVAAAMNEVSSLITLSNYNPPGIIEDTLMLCSGLCIGAANLRNAIGRQQRSYHSASAAVLLSPGLTIGVIFVTASPSLGGALEATSTLNVGFFVIGI